MQVPCGSPATCVIVAPAEDAHVARAAFINDFVANAEGVFVARHAPAKVHVHKMDAARKQFLAQLRKDKAHEMVALGLHVFERAADEDADGFPGGAHGGDMG